VHDAMKKLLLMGRQCTGKKFMYGIIFRNYPAREISNIIYITLGIDE